MVLLVTVWPVSAEAGKYTRDGVNKTYFQNGDLKSECDYRTAAKNGPCRHYYPDGQLLNEAFFRYGKVDGTSTWYRPDGSIRYQDLFFEGAHLKRKAFDREGNLTEIEDIEPGRSEESFEDIAARAREIQKEEPYEVGGRNRSGERWVDVLAPGFRPAGPTLVEEVNTSSLEIRRELDRQVVGTLKAVAHTFGHDYEKSEFSAD